MLGAHTSVSQKRKILALGVAIGVVILVAVMVWQTGAQKPVKRSYTPVSVTQTTVGSESAPTAPAQSTTTTILAPKISKSAGSEGIVTDANGNAVTTGSVSLTIADVTQGWSYVVNGAPGGAGTTDTNAFTCLVVENSPRVGEYSGCGLSQNFIVSPQDGDTLTEIATYAGTSSLGSSVSGIVNYTMP